VRAPCAGVLLEALLGKTVEGQCRNGTLEARGDNAPVTLRAAPAGEMFVLGPDHPSIHSYTHSCISMHGVPTGGEGRTTRHWRVGAQKLNQCPRRRQSRMEFRKGKVTRVLRPIGQGLRHPSLWSTILPDKLPEKFEDNGQKEREISFWPQERGPPSRMMSQPLTIAQ
jgi:hypothetical protein